MSRTYAKDQELDKNIAARIDTLKDEVRKMLVSKTDKPLAKVNLIDSICRLGVSYHFEHEIDDILQDIHKCYVENGEITLEDNLYSLAVLFRVLRQQGFHVFPNVFNKFKDKQRNFNENLITDVEGMLSLYEASHMMIHGEEILEEALSFTSTHLESIATELSPFLATQVKNSLRQALHKNLPRLESRRYISIYEQDSSHDEILLTLAKLDFNFLQSLYQKEFGNICKWWKELDLANKLPYARDRIIECSFWVLTTFFEPKYSQARKIMTKTINLLSVIDDTYDAYGTIDELELFTKAIERLTNTSHGRKHIFTSPLFFPWLSLLLFLVNFNKM
ncbi:(-)-germacrene D synthase-like [Trifolium pratense]|uniref:(-)-germacrene D synthase-like n=1 Tax=Trifolium pratense TaxID=57577 RepID=UPI001E69244C|nr:(-)-germacrene D synthase-like [Trifolium pratense]